MRSEPWQVARTPLWGASPLCVRRHQYRPPGALLPWGRLIRKGQPSPFRRSLPACLGSSKQYLHAARRGQGWPASAGSSFQASLCVDGRIIRHD